MNKLILPFIVLNLIGGVGAGLMFWMSGFSHLWLGVMLATLPIPVILLLLTNVLGLARTSARLPVAQLLGVAGIALVAQSVWNTQHIETSQVVALLVALFGVLSVQWYVWVYSSYGRNKSQAISKGKPLPVLSLKRLDGSAIGSDSFSGTQTLLVFFRANWCPFCMNQLKEVVARADRLKQAKVEVKFISNQGVALSSQLAEKLDLPEHFEILQDDELQAARTLGIEDIDGTPAGMPGYPKDTVMATVIALNERGEVIFGDETDNYRVRPHPDTFLPVFE